jgi:hypothetical protein
MSKELFGRYIDSVLREYLKFEKPIRTFFDDNMATRCRQCPPDELCCSYRSEKNLTAWDTFVMDKNFSQWRDISEKSKNGSYCQFLSEKGCIIPTGRPNICTAHICLRREDVLDYESRRDILDTYKRIGMYMDWILRLGVGSERESQILTQVDDCFRVGESAIKDNERFREKFAYEPIL